MGPVRLLQRVSNRVDELEVVRPVQRQRVQLLRVEGEVEEAISVEIPDQLVATVAPQGLALLSPFQTPNNSPKFTTASTFFLVWLVTMKTIAAMEAETTSPFCSL